MSDFITLKTGSPQEPTAQQKSDIRDALGAQVTPSEGAFVDGDKTKLDAQSGTNTGDEVSATESGAGVVELATTGEATTGTDTTRATTPAGVKAAIDAADPIGWVA